MGVLLVDDNPEVQDLVESTLQKSGLTVISVNDGLSALDLAISEKPDLILADCLVKGIDIATFVKKIQRRAALADIPIVLLLQEESATDPVALQLAGMHAILKKPLDPILLSKEVKKQMGITESEIAATTADALYTESLTSHGAALLTNDNILPYAGEDFERVMIHLISALNYAQQGQLAEALVECRRVDTKLNSINDRYQEKKNGYKEDAFARYLSGILYEAQGGSEGINDAFISYRKAFETYREWAVTYGTPIPPMIGADLMRTTDALHLREEHEEYKKLFPATTWTKIADQKGYGEMIIVSLDGKSPRKENLFFDIVIDKNILNSIVSTAIWQSHVGSGNIPISTIGQLVRIALPKYIPQKSDVGHLSVGVAGTVSLSSQ